MKQILVLEDDELVVENIQNKLNKYFDVFPIEYNENNLLKNGNLILRKIKTDSGRAEILKYYNQIDLFIIDVTLGGNDKNGDTFGLDFFTQLSTSNYRAGNYDCIFLTRHSKASDPHKTLDKIKGNYTVISKQTKTDGDYTDEIASYLTKKYNLKIQHNESGPKQTESDKKLKAEIDRFITGSLYFLMIVCLLSAVINITIDISKPAISPIVSTIKGIYIDNNQQINPRLDAKTKSVDSAYLKSYSTIVGKVDKEEISVKANEDIKKLEIVEHIFIYLLPLFIIFGFYNYYKYTTSIILVDGNFNEIDNGDAIKYLNASKIILLSSLLSFALIKGIEKIFILEIKDPIPVIAYCSFIIILMLFILFLHKVENHSSKKGEK